MWWQTWAPDPVLLSLSSWQIRWYGLLVAIAVGAAYTLTRYLSKKTFNPVIWQDCLLWVVISGFIGARLLHVALEWSYYVSAPEQILQVWQGGLAIHGGLIGGAIGLYLFARRRGLSFISLAAAIVPGVALAQAIGRWGNYFNQELYGLQTTGWWGIYIEPWLRVTGYESFPTFHPVFLYESLALIALALLLWKLYDRLSPIKLVAAYLIGYGLIRFLVEFWRIDQQHIFIGLRFAQWESVVLGILGIVIFLRDQYLAKR